MNIQPFRLLGAFLLVLAALALAACGSASPQRQASLALGIDAAQGEPVFFTDTHGGFHGDGLTYAELHFSGDACLL